MLNFKFNAILLVAFLLQFIIFNPLSKVYDPDVDSAIRRAKTTSCKREIEELAIRISREQEESPMILKRQCKLDSGKNRIQKVGCASNSTKGLIKIDENVNDLSDCLELCFTFGHSFAGFGGPSNKCFCGDGKHQNFDDNSRQQNCQENADFDWFQVDYGIYNHRSKRAEQDPSPVDITNGNPIGQDSVRIAFLLILNGRTTLQIQRLLKSIYSRRHLYYLHVDSTDQNLFNDLLVLEKEHVNVHLARSRFNTIWGGPALLRMMIDSMSYLVHDQWDYLINLSASDFPVKPLSELESYLGRDNKRMIYLKSHNIKGYDFIKKQGLDFNFYQCENRVWKLGKRKLPRGIVFDGGSDWYALPRDFCSYILRNLGDKTSLVRPLVQLFNYTLLPAESFFHTLASNSEFCHRMADTNLRLTNWKRKDNCPNCQHTDVVDWCGCSPMTYRISDWPKLLKTNYSSKSIYFSRKFDPTISLSIINEVEDKLLATEQSKNDRKNQYTSYWRDLHYKGNSSDYRYKLSFLTQIGDLSLSQAIKYQQKFPPNPDDPMDYKLNSVHEYFDLSGFSGLIYNYCDRLVCLELLVKERDIRDAHITIDDDYCISSGEDQRLRDIRINHGFDPREKIFRENLPMSQNSDIIVYTEWEITRAQPNTSDLASKPDRIIYNWLDPGGRQALEQEFRIKPAAEDTIYRIAKRLKINQPVAPGLWTLKISKRGRGTCLEYKFLVFDSESHNRDVIPQDVFDSFYYVSDMCCQERTKGQAGNSNLLRSIFKNCSDKEWSLINRKMYSIK